MVKNLINITIEEINESTECSVQNDNIKIMYLQNNGSDKHRWNEDDIISWMKDDFDD